MEDKGKDSSIMNKKIDQVIEQIVMWNDVQTQHVQNLIRIGVALSSQTDQNKLFELILNEAIAYTNADAATIYKVSEDFSQLDFVIVYNRTLDLCMGGAKEPISWPSLPLYDEKGQPRLKHIVTNVFHKRRPLCFEDVYETRDYDISGTREIDEANRYRSKSMLTLPLQNHEGEVLGVLQIINAMGMNGSIIPFQEEHIVMLNSLASQVAIAMSNRKLIHDLEALLMEFIQVIAKAIERKSIFSSNHISRVAILAEMIANRINADRSGHYREFCFSPDELQELSMAAFMHDVGKIITPDSIINKSTKLESITDRIEIIGMRFQMFKMALALEQSLTGGERILELAASWYPDSVPNGLDDLFDRLDRDLDFLRKVNHGSEFLSAQALERIDRISGIQIIIDSQIFSLLSEEEAAHLQIRRGTLSLQEKQKMDEHVQDTWEMLSQLTYPKKFKNVALYAASHHEKLNGGGHPFGLKEEQLPLQSRILAIADIYEALTAPDRPYKKAKNLSEALTILAYCAKDKEIDSDLLDFILDSGLYAEFASSYMDPQQIDDIDLESIKRIYHKETAD